MDPDPWICIFLRIRIQEANILRIQRIHILSTDQTSIHLETSRLEDLQVVRWETLVWSDLASLNYMTGGRSTHRPETGTVGQPYPGALTHCQAGVS